jgi:biopolymer transport protein ExbB/TolQ/DNA-directed RNA polymerase subunit RPC12/RpoP
MYFEFACSNCGKNLKVRPEHAGRRVSCPYCRTQIIVPTAEEEAVEEIEEFVEQTSGPSQRPRPKPAAAARQRVAAGGRTGGEKWADGTNVSMLISGAIGLGLAAAFFILIYPFSGTYLGKLFIKSDTGWWVQPMLTFLMGWAVAMLVLKSRKLKRQKASMLFDLLPNELGRDITVGQVDRFVSHIRSLPVAPGESFLVNRVLRGLEHFRVRRSAAEVSTVMASQSEIDANSVDSSYTLMKVFIWAIPILGFIGTVIGIGAAVGGFSGQLEDIGQPAAEASADGAPADAPQGGGEAETEFTAAATNAEASDAPGDTGAIDKLKQSLFAVTNGLATAFDTTLVALVMSMLVMFPTSSMQKAEEDLLNWVDEYCNENLLKRLDDGRGGIERGTSLSPAQIKEAIDAAMVAHQAELKVWAKKLETIGGTITNQVAQGWQRIQEQNLARAQDLERMASQFQANIASMTQNADSTQQDVAETMRESAEAIHGYMAELERGLRGLSDVLADLGQHQVVVQQAPRRGWFSGWRKNGGNQGGGEENDESQDKWR